MAVFRVEKDKNFTVMSNVHLRDQSLSLKAKGLLSQMLSLPEDWDYTLRGLASINRESVNTIGGIVKELIRAGYIVREQSRKEAGRFSHAEYIIYETPHTVEENDKGKESCADGQKSISETSKKYISGAEKDAAMAMKRDTETLDFKGIAPCHKKRDTVKRDTDFCDNNKIPKGQNTDVKSISSIPRNTCRSMQPGRMEGREYQDQLKTIRGNIGYKDLILMHPDQRELIDGIVDLIVDVVTSQRKTISVGGEQKPAEVVKARFSHLKLEDIEYMLLAMSENTTQIRDMMAYLRTAIYNAPVTRNIYYQARVNHDLYGNRSSPEKNSG